MFLEYRRAVRGKERQRGEIPARRGASGAELAGKRRRRAPSRGAAAAAVAATAVCAEREGGGEGHPGVAAVGTARPTAPAGASLTFRGGRGGGGRGFE